MFDDFFIVLVMSILSADLTEYLVAHYPFNGNADDESGNGNDGTILGATFTTNRFGNENCAYYFNGSNSFIEINDSYSPDIAYSDYSIVAWIKTENTGNNGRIFSKGSSQCVPGYMMRMGGPNSSKAFLENVYNGSCKIILQGNTSINNNF